MTLLNSTVIVLLISFSAMAYLNRSDPQRAPVFGATAAAPPSTRIDEAPRARVDRAKLAREIRDRVTTPLRETRIDLRRFSRVRIPRSRSVHYRIETAPDPDRGFAAFRVFESHRVIRGLPEDTHVHEMPDGLLEEGGLRQIAAGRIDLRSLAIRLAPNARDEPANDAYLPLADALTAMGVETDPERR